MPQNGFLDLGSIKSHKLQLEVAQQGFGMHADAHTVLQEDKKNK